MSSQSTYMLNTKWMFTVIVVGSVALVAGLKSGRSSADEEWRQLVSRAGLSFECKRQLETAATEDLRERE